MNIDAEIIRKLAHSGLKTLGSLRDFLRVYDLDSKGGLHNQEIRNGFFNSLTVLMQVIGDLQLLVDCENLSSEAWDPVNWKVLAESRLEGRKGITLTIDNADYEGRGHPNLIDSALGNLIWFARGFYDGSARVRLETIEQGGRPWIRFQWDFGNAVSVTPEFATFPPFYLMHPNESRALGKSTGLALYAVKRILEIHGGTLTAQSAPDNLTLEWNCPKVSEFKPKAS